MKPLSKEKAEEALRGEGREGWKKKRDALQRLPADVDAELAARVALSQIGDGYNAGWGFGRACQRLPPHVIRRVVELLPAESQSAQRIFLREAMRGDQKNDAALVNAWVLALQSLLDLSLTYAWGSKQRKAKLKALAGHPQIVSAIQAAVVGSDGGTIDMLAVLAIDASDASIDALLPVFSKGDPYSRLEMLKVHATMNAAMTAMLEMVTKRRTSKEEASGAAAFVSKVLALDEPLKTVKCTVWLSSEQLNRSGVPLYQGTLVIDSKWDSWWSVAITQVTGAFEMKRTGFGASEDVDDELGLGHCTIHDLPKWLAAAAKKLKVKWNTDAVARGSLRGKKRDELTAWVFSGVKPS
ncbi:MAG: hypothetical protein QM817_19935 [Archangium sp.]